MCTLKCQSYSCDYSKGLYRKLRKDKTMDKNMNDYEQNLQGSNVVNITESIVNEIMKLLTKEEIKGYLTPKEKKKYFHYLNMLSEVYKDKGRGK